MAMYCFNNHGWAPSKFLALPERERLFISLTMLEEIKSRDKKVR